MTDRVERVQNLRRSNAAGKHKQAEPCEHRRVTLTDWHGSAWCESCGDTWDYEPFDTIEEWRGDK